MILRRRNRLFAVLFALISLLFMQLAVASYVCPGVPSKISEMGAMPCAESMTLTIDDEQPSLCHAHCQSDQQSVDKYQVPGLASLADLATDFPLPRIAPAPSGVPLQAPLLRRTTAPPLTVRNCCFRI